MPKGKNIGLLLHPVRERPIQAYFGQGLHTLGLLGWLLPQMGQSDVWVSSYSTSEAFLSGFCLLRNKRLIRHSAILLDQRAARKTIQLEQLLGAAFEHVFLGQNHSKLLLLHNSSGECVSVVTSQNQTYGARAESTIVSTDRDVFNVLMEQYTDICGDGAAELDLKNGKGIISLNECRNYGESIITGSRETRQAAADSIPDWSPFGIEW